MGYVSVRFNYVSLRFAIQFYQNNSTTVTFAYVLPCTPAIFWPLFKDLSSDRFLERTPIPKVEPRSWVATAPPCGPLGFAERFSYVSLRLGSRLVTFGNGSSVSDSWAQRLGPSSTTWDKAINASHHSTRPWLGPQYISGFNSLNKPQAIRVLHQTWSFMLGHDFMDLMVTFVAFPLAFHYVWKKTLTFRYVSKVTFLRFARVPRPVLVRF